MQVLAWSSNPFFSKSWKKLNLGRRNANSEACFFFAVDAKKNAYLDERLELSKQKMLFTLDPQGAIGPRRRLRLH